MKKCSCDSKRRRERAASLLFHCSVKEYCLGFSDTWRPSYTLKTPDVAPSLQIHSPETQQHCDSFKSSLEAEALLISN